MAKEQVPATAEEIHILEGVTTEEVGTIMLGLRDHGYEHAVWLEAVGSNDEVARLLIQEGNRKSDPTAFFEGMHLMAAIGQGRGKADEAERALLAPAEETTGARIPRRRLGLGRQKRHRHEHVGTLGTTTLALGILGLRILFKNQNESSGDDAA